MGNRLYVGNFAFSATEQTLRDPLAKSHQVNDVRIVVDRERRRSRGFAFVTTGSAREAAAAIAAINGVNLDGRALRINRAGDRPQRTSGGGGGGSFGRGNKW